MEESVTSVAGFLSCMLTEVATASEGGRGGSCSAIGSAFTPLKRVDNLGEDMLH